ncbi:hypothetical protein L7F22_026057 [Adiantum nelumboides]|nr:hypothetical protein [Adiantum nelumboides]
MFIEDPNQEVQSKERNPVIKESEGKKEEQHKKKHHKQKSFKSGDKDVKFDSYNGRWDNDKALAFIRQFEVAFVEGNFKERSKLCYVSMYLEGTASSWWLTMILENRKPQDWSAFKRAFYAQFLPPDFEQEVKKEWDRLSQLENEIVPQYVDKFWDILLKVTPFKKIEDSEKMRKFEAGLHDALRKAIKLYPRNNLQVMMESARIADALHEKEDGIPEEQPEVEELDEIVVLEQILAHKKRKVRGKVARRYLVKFKNYPPMDAKWMEEAELADSSHLSIVS